jgi:hypothetical protein
LQIALPVWKYTPVGPPVPIVKNSADFATPVKDKDATKISRALDRDVIIFFHIFSSKSLFLLTKLNSN